MQNVKHKYWNRTLLRHVTTWTLTLIALLFLGDTIRVAFFPPSRTDISTFEETRIEVHVARKFIWRYDDCVNVRWQVTNAEDVYFNGEPAPPSGERAYCLSPNPPEAAANTNAEQAEQEEHWNYGNEYAVYTTLRQYPDVVVMARVHDNIDTFLHVSAPIYVLTDDALWLWRVVLAAVCLVAALYIAQIRSVRRVVDYIPGVLRRNSTFATLCGVSAVFVIVFATQTIHILLILFDLIRFAIGNGFVPVEFAWGSVSYTIGILAAFAGASTLMGAFFLRLVSQDLLKDDDLGYLATVLILGQGLLSLLLLVLGIFGVFTKSSVIALLVIGSLGGSMHLREIIQRIYRVLKGTWRLFSRETIVWKVILVLSLAVIPLATLRVFTDINWDGHTTYMTQAKIIATTGSVAQPARDGDLHYAASGLVGEVKMAAAYVLAGDAAARMQSWTVFAAIVAMGIALARSLNFSQRGQIIALVSLVTSSLLYGMVGWGKVDIYGFAPALAAIFVARQLADVPRSSTAFLVGLLAGIAVIAKITYLPTLGIFLPLFTIFAVKPRQLPRLWIFMVIGGLIPIALFVLRNGVVLGEPLAPFIFLNDSPSAVEISTANPRERLLRQSYIFYPLTWYGSYSFSTLVYLTPIWLILLPIIIWRLFHHRTNYLQKVMTWCAIAAFVVWGFTFSNILPLRYQAAILVIFLLIASEGLAAILANTGNRLIRSILTFSLFFALASVFISETAIVGGKLIDPQIRYDCRPSPMSLCEGFDILNAAAPTDSRVLTNVPFYYYLREDLIMCRGEKADHLRLLEQSQQDMWMYLYQHGFKYVMDWHIEDIWHAVSRQYTQIYPVVPFDPDEAPDWLEVTTLFESDAMRLYRLDVVDSSMPMITSSCRWNGALNRVALTAP